MTTTRRRASTLPLARSPGEAGGILTPTFPATVVIDTREQHKYTFDSIPADAVYFTRRVTPEAIRDSRLSLRVPTITATLPSGDYSLAGHETAVAVERKSAADLFSTIGQSRDRFERELIRLSTYTFAAVVVESEWSEIFANPPRHSLLHPRSVFRSILAWQQRYPRIHWHFWAGRDAAEKVTFRILERFWKEREAEKEVVRRAERIEKELKGSKP